MAEPQTLLYKPFSPLSSGIVVLGLQSVTAQFSQTRVHKAGNESGLEEGSMRLLGQHYSTGHYNTDAQSLILY